MSELRHNDQMNVRAPAHVLEALRRERDRRGLTLGDTVAALLELAERDRQDEGLKFTLPPHLLPPLRAAAAAVGEAPHALLMGLLEGELHERLVALASRLAPSAPVAERTPVLPAALPPSPAFAPPAPAVPAGAVLPVSGTALRCYRLDAGLSQRGLADALLKPSGRSYTQQSVALIERRDTTLSRGFLAALEAAVVAGRLPPVG